MSSTLIILVLLSSIRALALSYSVENSEFYPALDINEISQNLSKHGFYEVDLRRVGKFMNTNIDQLYLHSVASDTMAVLKLDIVLNSSQKILNLSESERVCHGRTSRGRNFALYLKGIKLQHFTNICNSFLASATDSRTSILKVFFLNEAHAQSVDCFDSSDSKFSLAQVQSSIGQSTVIQSLGTCLSAALRGSENTISGIGANFISLMTHPLDLWNELSSQAIALKDFLVHLKDEVIQMKEAFGNLDSELILNLACQLGGEILTSAGIAVLTGAGLAKLSTTLMQAVLKLKSIQSIMARLTQLKKLGQSKFAEEILSCAAH